MRASPARPGLVIGLWASLLALAGAGTLGLHKGDIFSAPSLQARQGIHRDLTQYVSDYELKKTSPLGHIESVTDLINIGFLQHSDEKVMIARNFIGRELPATDEERDVLRQQALAHPNYKSIVLSPCTPSTTKLSGRKSR